MLVNDHRSLFRDETRLLRAAFSTIIQHRILPRVRQIRLLVIAGLPFTAASSTHMRRKGAVDVTVGFQGRPIARRYRLRLRRPLGLLSRPKT